MSSNSTSPYRPASPGPASSGLKFMPTADLDLRDIVVILRRRRVIILAVLLMGVTLASLSVMLAQKEYSATTTIEINKESGDTLGISDLSGLASDLGDEDAVNAELLTEQAIIMSDNTALGVIERLKLDAIPPYAIPPTKGGKETPLDRERGLPLERAPLQRERLLGLFSSRLSVKLIKGTRLVTVTYTDTEPSRSAAIANAVVDVYIDQNTQARYQASLKTSSWLANQLADLKAKVETSQAKVDEFQRESGLTGMTFSSAGGRGGESATVTPSSDNVPLERLLELNRDLTNAEVSRIAKEAIYKMTETQDPDVVLGIGSSSLVNGLGSDSVLAPGSSDLTLLQHLRQQQAQLKVQLAAASSKYGAKNPAILQLHDEETALDAQIRAELARIRSRAKNDLDLATLAEKGIQEQIRTQEQEVNKVAGKADQLILLQEEALSRRKIYQDLYAKLEEASVTAGIRASNITLVNPARIPAQPSFPKARRTIGLGGILGLVFGLIGAFSWDYFDDSITIPEQVEHMTTVPVIGAIPDFAQRQSLAGKYGFASKSQEPPETKSASWLLRAPRSEVSEAYRTFRTALLMSRAEQPPRVILIMSGSPSEGKSTTCFNAATAFALQGDRVLYLDADLRRAQAHISFKCTNDVGLSNCLTSAMSYQEVLKRSPEIDSLFLLPSGPAPPNPAELIGSKRFIDLLAELREQFDYVFIDSPPVLLVTDAQLISSHVDGYVMVLRSGDTSKRSLQRTLALMRAAKTAALGIVVNAINAKDAAYSGYGYYGGGSGYYVEAEK
jgi:polysaccharide biosynthesis transport protein